MKKIIEVVGQVLASIFTIVGLGLVTHALVKLFNIGWNIL